ncbi:MAG: PilZ domain-containing protein [Alphaproteobacteria bacterium]|nr:PilZ domain-containing protein [Alphaproteobacteria bacterium]
MPEREVEPNRRGVGRQRVLKKGLILFNDGRSSITCHIVDISDTGAKLVPVDVFSCPSEFLLKLPIGEPRECEVMWRRGDRVGVRFLGLHKRQISDDRRRNSRRRLLQPASIVFNNGHSKMACQIVDTSEFGAKIAPADVYACPRQFVLQSKSYGTRQCAVLWRRGSTIGVRFL